VLEYGLAEGFVSGHVGLVECLEVQLHKTCPLRLGDPQVAVDVDEMGEAELPAEAIGAAEGLGGEPRQVLDVMGLAGTEERLEQLVGEDLGVEEVFKTVQTFLASGVLVEGGHALSVPRHPLRNKV
jgi:hypothetical protein